MIYIIYIDSIYILDSIYSHYMKLNNDYEKKTMKRNIRIYVSLDLDTYNFFESKKISYYEALSTYPSLIEKIEKQKNCIIEINNSLLEKDQENNRLKKSLEETK